MLQFSTRRATRRAVSVLACGIASVGCHLQKSAAIAQPHGPGLTAVGPEPTSEVVGFYQHFGWNLDYANITGFNDEQKLAFMGNSGNREFGPRVRLYVSSRLDSLTKDEFETAPTLVGLAEVWPNTAPSLPSSYTRLKFKSSTSKELYCIRLQHDKTQPLNDGWSGWVIPYASGGNCDVTSAETKLPVGVDDDGGNGNAGNFPPVVRLTMDNQEQPGLGVACLAAWCELGYATAGYAPPAHSSGKGEEWRIKGWQDEQFLSVPDGAGHLKPWKRGGLVPVPNLESIRIGAYLSDWQRVGSIWLDDNPPSGSTYANWKLAKGESDVWLKAYRKTPADTVLFMAAFTVGGQKPTVGPTYAVSRHGWNVRVPGVLRFVWASDDDLFWVSCDMGCCTVGDQVRMQ